MKKKQHKTPKNLFLHLMLNFIMGLFLIVGALLIGVLGYRFSEHMSWVDSFLNASMILSGMGPATSLQTTGGKIFAGVYALFSGLAFIAVVVMMLSPLIHRFFRKIHMETKNQDS